MPSLDQVVLGLGLSGQAMLLGANVFEAVVDVPNWRRPEGLVAYRQFAVARNAGHFYRVMSPVTLVVLGAALVLGYTGFGVRDLLVLGALAAGIVAEVFTVAYFFPRNRSLFFEPIEVTPGARSAALVGQWGRANQLRVFIVACGLGAGLGALMLGSRA